MHAMHYILDSERSDKCVDFTIMCDFFCLYTVHTISCRNNASILNFSSFSGWKVNLVGALGRSTFEILSNFLKNKKNNK